MKIGNLDLPSKVILAPMSGITDYPFRKIVRKFGEVLVMSEMVASRAMIVESKHAMRRSDVLQDQIPWVQIAGYEPDVMAEAAKLNEGIGAKIIDINFGCPAKKIVNNYAGSYLMKDEVRAAKILEAVVNAVKVPVTLKMRLGWDENNKNSPTIAKIAESSGIQMITVHGRTRCQFFKDRSDWKSIKKVKDSVKVPVVANGDIIDFDSTIQALEESGADGVMVGRAACGKPWLINQMNKFLLTQERSVGPSLGEKLDTVLEHYNSIIEYYGEVEGTKIARKHINWYTSGMRNSHQFRSLFFKETIPKEAGIKIKEFFIEHLQTQ